MNSSPVRFSSAAEANDDFQASQTIGGRAMPEG